MRNRFLRVRCGVLFALLISIFLSAPGSSAVVFYAPFDGSADAKIASVPGVEAVEGSPTFQPGKRGQAYFSGDGKGYLAYDAANIPAKEGTLEFWLKPVDWNAISTDNLHAFVETDKDSAGNWFMVWKYLVQYAMFIREADTGHAPTIRRLPDWHGWIHLAVTWSPAGSRLYFNGQPTTLQIPTDPPRKYVGKMKVGDRAWQPHRNEHSLIDELYMYDRALEPEEIKWAMDHVADRAAGQDVPGGLVPTRVHAKILPSLGKIIAQVKPRLSADRLKGLTAVVELVGPTPLPPVVLTSKDGGMEATLPFRKLETGNYKLRARFKDASGKVVDEAEDPFFCPKNEWLGNKIGTSDTPPPPFTPLQAFPSSFKSWGREYTLNGTGLPSQITSGGQKLLKSPIELSATVDGHVIAWTPAPIRLLKNSALTADYAGRLTSDIGSLDWEAAPEYDGMVKYHLTITPLPGGASVDRLELRFPITEQNATLRNCMLAGGGMSIGTMPAGQGVLIKSLGSNEWWVGNEERGLGAFCESDEAWDQIDRPDGFSIARSGDGVDVVWSFISGQRKLDKPWSFTFGLTATPIKSLVGQRGRPTRIWPQSRWRLPERNYPRWSATGLAKEIENEGMRGDKPVAEFVLPWLGGEWRTYNPDWGFPDVYKEGMAKLRAKGLRPITYMLANQMPESAPQWRFWSAEWASNGKAGMTDETWDNTVCPQSWVDYVVWYRMGLLKEYGLSGYWVDNGMPKASVNLDAGAGYVRDGKLRGTMPYFGFREVMKRLYTAMKQHERETGQPTMIMMHMSSVWPMSCLGFMDTRLDGEQWTNDVGNLKKDYYDLVPLEKWQAEFLSANVGSISTMRTQFAREQLIDPTKARGLLSLLLLHDVQVMFTVDEEATSRVLYGIWQIEDQFGIQNADFLPYWNNSDIVPGQSEKLKVSVYHRPEASLLILSNLGTSDLKVDLRPNWSKLTRLPRPRAWDAESGARVLADNSALSLSVPARNYRIVWVGKK